MKKYLFMLLCIAACAEIQTPGTSEKLEMEFYAGSDATRTTISGTAIEWEAGDEISVFDRESNNRFVTSQSGASAVFRGSACEEESYYAVYPYDASLKVSSGCIDVVVPDVQTLRPDTFPEGANVSVAKSVGNVLAFKNICGYVKFAVDRGDWTKIVIEAASGVAVAGGVTVSFDADGLPHVQSKTPSVTLTLLPSAETIAPGTYYVPLLPGEYEAGLNIYLYEGNGNVYKSTVSLVDRIDRCVPLNIGAIDRNITFDRFVLNIDFSTNSHGIVAEDDKEIHQFALESASGEDYVFNYCRCRWHENDRFLFKGGSSKPYGFISFPAIDGLRLGKVTVTVIYGSDSIKTLKARVTDYNPDDPVTYSPSQTIDLSPEVPLAVVDYPLAESERGVSYMLYASVNKNCYIQSISLVYVE